MNIADTLAGGGARDRSRWGHAPIMLLKLLRVHLDSCRYILYSFVGTNATSDEPTEMKCHIVYRQIMMFAKLL